MVIQEFGDTVAFIQPIPQIDETAALAAEGSPVGGLGQDDRFATCRAWDRCFFIAGIHDFLKNTGSELKINLV